MTPTEFKIIFPAFEGEAELRVQYALDSAAPFFDEIIFKDFSSSYYFATRVIYSAMCQMREAASCIAGF